MSNTKTVILSLTEMLAKLIAAVDGQKVNKIAGKGLSENDFTDAFLNKLNGIESNAKGDQNASEVPTTSIPGVTGGNVQSMLESIKSLIDALDTGMASAILPPVAATADLVKNAVDKALCHVEATGLYRWDAQSSASASGNNIIIPTGHSGAGRWIRISDPMNEHNNQSGIQGGNSTQRYHLTLALLNKLEGIESNAKDDQNAGEVPASTISGFAGANVQALLESIAAKVAALDSVDHSHTNKSILDGITSTLINHWNSAYAVTSDLEANLTITAIKNEVDAEINAPYLQAIIDTY